MTIRPRVVRHYRVSVDGSVCDGCAICVFYCKPDVFEIRRELNPRGIYPAAAPRPDACTGCRLCELGCPQMAIYVASIEEGP